MMMYLGSLIVALAVEECGLHQRIALRALMAAGTSPARIMLGFMLPTAFLSMWISNTATTAMMVPILEVVMGELGLSQSGRTMMLLAVAYSANVGGTGTIIGIRHGRAAGTVALINPLFHSYTAYSTIGILV